MRYIQTFIVLTFTTVTLTLAKDSLSDSANSFSHPNQGIELFKNRIVDNPQDYISLSILAKLYLADAKIRGDIQSYSLAKSNAQQALDVESEYTPAQVAMIGALIGLHQFSEAKKIAYAVILKEPNNNSAKFALADILFESGDYVRAEEQIEKLKNEFEEDPSILYRQARLLELRGKKDEALILLLKASKQVESSSDDGDLKSWYHLQIGKRYLMVGELKEAQNHYQVALKLSKNPIHVYEYLGELAAIDTKLDAAQKYFGDAFELSPRPDLLQAQGDVAALKGDRRAASNFFQRAREAYELGEREIPGVYAHQLASLYCESLADSGKAIFYAQRDLDARKTVGAFDALAWALFRAGRYEEAKSNIDKAMQSGTREAHLLYHASMIYGANGHLEKSRKLLQEARDITPYVNSFHIHR